MEDDNSSESQARAQLASISEMIDCLRRVRDGEQVECNGETYADEDDMLQFIHEDPLCLEVSDGWYCPGDRPDTPDEYRLLLCTGGPAVRIVGELDDSGQPSTARIEHQDWFTPWTELRGLTDDEEAALLEYAQCFYFTY